MADATLRELERAAAAGDRDAMESLLAAWRRAGSPVSKVPHRLMTPDEVTMSTALARCRFAPGTWAKKFALNMGTQARAIAPWITDAQARHLRREVQAYRRQIPAEVVALAATACDRTCGTCGQWVEREGHARRCPAHPIEAARREREALGMFAPPEEAAGA